MSIRLKLVFICILVLMMSIVVGIVGIMKTTTLKDVSDDIIAMHLKKTKTLDDIRYQISEVRRSELQTVISTDEKSRKKYGDRAILQFKTIEQLTGDLDKLLETDSERAIIATFKDDYASYKQVSSQAMALARQNKLQEAVDYFRVTGRERFDALTKSTDALLKSNAAMVAAAEVLAEETYSSAETAIVLALAAALVTGLGITWYFSGRVTNSVKTIAKKMENLAQGDLSQGDLVINSGDEIGDMAKSFMKMVASFRALISNTVTASGQVAATSEQLSVNVSETSRATEQVALAIESIARDTSEETNKVNQTVAVIGELTGDIDAIASGSAQQSASVSTTSRAIEDMVRSIEEVVANAQAMLVAARQTSDVANNGGQVVGQTIDGMERIKRKVFEAGNKIKELGEQSHQIGEIIQVIDDIAEQTNLLALNAAIEAARAGEHGKGFAVVADEVRKLAERSGKATKEIADLINSIQAGTKNAVTAMEDGIAEVEEGSRLAANAGTSLEEILETTKSTLNQVQTITAAADNMSMASSEVVDSIGQVARITDENLKTSSQMTERSKIALNEINSLASIFEQNAAAAQEVAASTEEMNATAEEVLSSTETLSGMARELKSQVNRFKL